MLQDITPEGIAAAPMSVEFFSRMMEKLASQHGDGQGAGDPYLAAFFAFVEVNDIPPGQGDDGVTMSLQDHLTIQSATSRFFALGQLEQAGHLKNWSRNQGESILLHPALIEAACKSRLLVRGKKFHFQPMEFLNHALQAAETNKPFPR